jgi:pectate lyase
VPGSGGASAATGSGTGGDTTAGAGGTPGANAGGSNPTGAGGTGGDGSGGTVATGGAGGNGAMDGSGGFAGNGEPGVLRAFPGAEGFGRDALGGRGGTVCHVTTLADSGAGSLRDCVSQSNRTVVFDVGGWITLSSNLGITQNNLTIAGQTAPGNGIGVRGRKVSIGGSHIVLRFLRIRRGIVATTDRDDAMTVSSAAENVIIDHCSVGFGTDETLSMPGDEPIGPRNSTLQWSIVAWGLQRNNHSAGSLFTSNQTTIHHTLWAFNKTRNPRARSELASERGEGGHLDWVNNVIYGWNAPDPVGETEGWSLSHHPFILAGTSNGQHAANAVGNYFVSTRSAGFAFVDGSSNFSLYLADNLLDGNANGVLDASKSGTDMVDGSVTFLGERLAGPLVGTDSPAVAYERVLTGAGVTVPARDEADALLVSQVRAQSGILIQSEQDLVGLGVGDQGYGTLPSASRPAGFDTDGDGMPDAWETANGLDPAQPADGIGDADGDGYTNLEEYLNSLVP